MDIGKARDLLIKSGLSENKANEIAPHLSKWYNEDKQHKRKEKNINEVITNELKKASSFLDIEEVTKGGEY